MAVVTAALFVLRQLRCEHPLIDLTPMKSRAFWPSVVLTTIAMMGSFSMSVLLPLYLEGGTGLTAFAAGLLMLVPVLANAGTTLLGGRIMDARGEWPLLPAGFAAIAAGFALMAALAPTLSLLAAFIAALLIMGGTGFIFSPSQTAGLRTLPAGDEPVRGRHLHHVRADRGLYWPLAVHGHHVHRPGGRAWLRAPVRRWRPRKASRSPWWWPRASPRQVVHSRWFIRVPR